jgi:flagella basal body P-ring formation protein FlgA
VVAVIRFISLAARLRLGLFAVLLCLAGIKQASASAPTPIIGADINKLVAETMLAKGLKGAPRLSKSRKFLACKNGMSVEPMFGTWKTVKVSCNDEGSWTVMVRTNLKTKVKTIKKVKKAKAMPKKSTVGSGKTKVKTKKTVKVSAKVVKRQKQIETMSILALGRSMTRGDVIMPRDIITITVPVNAASGVFFNPEDIVGRKLKSSVTAKNPIQARHLKPKWLVEEDDEVVIQNQAGGISVNMVGLALENGQYGEWIKVQNVSSGIVIVGQIKNKKIISTNAKISPERVVN